MNYIAFDSPLLLFTSSPHLSITYTLSFSFSFWCHPREVMQYTNALPMMRNKCLPTTLLAYRTLCICWIDYLFIDCCRVRRRSRALCIQWYAVPPYTFNMQLHHAMWGDRYTFPLIKRHRCFICHTSNIIKYVAELY